MMMLFIHPYSHLTIGIMNLFTIVGVLHIFLNYFKKNEHKTMNDFEIKIFLFALMGRMIFIVISRLFSYHQPMNDIYWFVKFVDQNPLFWMCLMSTSLIGAYWTIAIPIRSKEKSFFTIREKIRLSKLGET